MAFDLRVTIFDTLFPDGNHPYAVDVLSLLVVGGIMPKHSADSSPMLFSEEDPLPLEKAVAITGSRDIPAIDSNELFKETLGAFIGHSRVWLLGGAIGIDHLATEWLLEKKEHVIAVVPFAVRDQPSAVHNTLGRVDCCIELHYAKSKKAYLDRNAFMVDRSNTVIAFWNGEKGGTWSTVQYALKNRKQVHVYPIAT